MEIQAIDLGSLLLVGAAVSLLVQYIKLKCNDNELKVRSILIFISILVGTIYYFLRGTPAWIAIVEIISVASAVWALLLKFTEKPKEQ